MQEKYKLLITIATCLTFGCGSPQQGASEGPNQNTEDRDLGNPVSVGDERDEENQGGESNLGSDDEESEGELIAGFVTGQSRFYESDCIQNASGSFNINYRYDQTITQKQTSYFSDKNCREGIYELVEKQEITRFFKFSDDRLGQNTYELDSILIETTIRPISRTAASSFAERDYCDYADWKAFELVSVSGKTCGSTSYHQADTVLYDIVRYPADLSTLEFGSQQASRKSERPETLSSQLLILQQ